MVFLILCFKIDSVLKTQTADEARILNSTSKFNFDLIGTIK